jgi:hypothetical protein
MNRRKNSRRGGGYGFGGSILSDAGGANAGNAQWNPDTSQDCGVDANRGGNGAFAGGALPANTALSGRGGNNPAGGKRRRSAKKSRRGGGGMTTGVYANRGGNAGGRRRKTMKKTRKGGMLSEAQLRAGQLNPALVQQIPRTGYTFDGSGVAGTPDPVRY